MSTATWWKTLAARRSTCEGCSRPIRRGLVVFVSYPGPTVVCETCGIQGGIASSALTSKRLLQTPPREEAPL
jgi:hypothetical protein